MEIEIKAQVDNLDSIRKRLRQLGIKMTKSVHQMDEYYSLYKRPYNKVNRGDILRVRYNHGEREGRLEYHTTKNKYATEEFEVAVGDVRELKKILRKMKAKREVIVNKRREYYRKGRFTITLDQVKVLGVFVEIEIQGGDTNRNRKAVIAMFARLGISKEKFRFNFGYNVEIVKRKGGKYGSF